MKEDSQDYKRQLVQAQRKLNNVQAKIEKKFSLIVNQYPQYISDMEKNYIERVGINDLTIEKKLDICICAEARYIEENSNQINLFN